MGDLAERSVEVLVMGGGHPSLAIARSLARNGVSFLLIDDVRSIAFRSRYVRTALLSPSPTTQPNAYVAFIGGLVEKHHIQVIIPQTDAHVIVLDRHRADLPSHATLAMAQSDALRWAMDKRANLNLARELGIPCPRQFALESVEQIPELIEMLGFPVVLKPPGPSMDGSPRPVFPFKVLYAHDEKQLRAHVAQYCHGEVFPMFQERATGRVHNLCCFAHRGEVLALHQYHSLRRSGGTAITRRIVPTDAKLEAYAHAMLRALQWDGVAHLQFFRSDDGKSVRYMEINTRLWASVEGSIHAGWDFPYWVYRYFRHGDLPTPGPLTIGSRTCWHRGDLEALLLFLTGGEYPATGSRPGKLRVLLHYLSGFDPAIHADVFRWDDPLPALADHWELATKVWTGLTHRRAVPLQRPE